MRSTEVIEVLATAKGPITAADVCVRLGLTVSGTNRPGAAEADANLILHELMADGVVARHEGRRFRWELTPQAVNARERHAIFVASKAKTEAARVARLADRDGVIS